jgi:predicted DNA-binding transcriptional regulator AlpA
MRLLGVGRTSVYSLVSAGKLNKPTHAVNRKASWPLSEIKEYIEQKKRERVAA